MDYPGQNLIFTLNVPASDVLGTYGPSQPLILVANTTAIQIQADIDSAIYITPTN